MLAAAVVALVFAATSAEARRPARVNRLGVSVEFLGTGAYTDNEPPYSETARAGSYGQATWGLNYRFSARRVAGGALAAPSILPVSQMMTGVVKLGYRNGLVCTDPQVANRKLTNELTVGFTRGRYSLMIEPPWFNGHMISAKLDANPLLVGDACATRLAPLDPDPRPNIATARFTTLLSSAKYFEVPLSLEPPGSSTSGSGLWIGMMIWQFDNKPLSKEAYTFASGFISFILSLPVALTGAPIPAAPDDGTLTQKVDSIFEPLQAHNIFEHWTRRAARAAASPVLAYMRIRVRRGRSARPRLTITSAGSALLATLGPHKLSATTTYQPDRGGRVVNVRTYTIGQ